MEKPCVLVVDDEQDIVDLVAYNLRTEGYEVLTASNGEEAIAAAATRVPDLAILDVMMPAINGFDVCRRLREESTTAGISVIFLTALSSEKDQVLGLELGADDYVQKPISPKVLLARVKSVLRRRSEYGALPATVVPQVQNVAGLLLNRRSYTVLVDNKELFFAKKEFELLAYLATNAGQIFSREELLKRIWGESVLILDRTVDVHISKVREKLGESGVLIETVKGQGYRFTNTAESSKGT